MNYCPRTPPMLTFHDAYERFLDGSDTPREYLERCLTVIDQREPDVQAWVTINRSGARAAADAATQRYRAGQPLSRIDGMPIGIKDMIETRDMPTELGSPAYAGRTTDRDSALVWALREAGAIILGKTVTTTLAFLDPGPTTNPFDVRRTPGGSSSGSAAAVGAAMVPVAIGTQLVASVLRPASYCGNWALKPTVGALNRGEGLEFSQSHIGVHAGCETDLWHVATEIARRAGGDPGYPGLYGEAQLPMARQPARLAVLETEGWQRVEPAARQQFEQALQRLQQQGITIVRRDECRQLDALENAIHPALDLSLRISAWEHRWILENMMTQHLEKIGRFLMNHVEKSRAQTLASYRADLRERDDARQHLQSLAPLYDAFISLCATGPAPVTEHIRDTRFPTGDLAMGCPSSLLGAPALNIPSLQANGLPLGIQLMGFQHGDERLLGHARWIHQALVGD